MLRLRSARPDETAALTELCLRSKAVWGYDEAFMTACRAELTITPDDLERFSLQVACAGNDLVGVAQVVIDGREADLAKLFVEPSALRTGAGRTLFDWAAREARRQGAQRLWIEADPDAAAFYRRMGAVDDGTVASGSIPGRLLPRLRLELSVPTATDSAKSDPTA
ncbi:N-acetyltransferase GCN5 [Afipia sp. P52-10]|uniref:GNAT family N-acetyltransferase n=1 Tax=Afipia sp. P52-10 TaxID=1429916 RepID=UPI0003DF387D|nr:GNAT family N-acetyltransferase [Afipia sp. P52-10]ETR76784.1 N-acetyltransferase GCN5 [Afipia sp. P52-10]